MSTTTDHGDVYVCTDCYFAHHYGYRSEPFEARTRYLIGPDYTADVSTLTRPLWLVDDLHVADNTDSETGEGIHDFSWSSCEGCGSHLGGSRYRLHLYR